GGGRRAGAEHGLHPQRGAGAPVADDGVAPQAELAATGADDLIGHQPEQRDPAGPNPALVRARVLARPPAGQLPADALGHREGGEQPVVPPQPAMFLPPPPPPPPPHPPPPTPPA